jgi:hypothetical protein
MAKERALDVFQLLARLDKKDYQIWDTLNEDQQKEFSAFITMRWMSGTSSAYQLVLLNELVNTTVFALPQHKELMMKLLAVCSDGSSKRYSWINYKMTSGSKKSKLAIKLVASKYNINESDAEDTVKHFNTEELIEMGESMGWQKDEIKELQKELK